MEALHEIGIMAAFVFILMVFLIVPDEMISDKRRRRKSYEEWEKYKREIEDGKRGN